MRTRTEIEERIRREDDPFTIETLRWVLDGGCPMCRHDDRKQYEIEIRSEEISPNYLEVRHGWSEGTVMNHMEMHVEWDANEAQHIEKARSQSINTLNAAEDIVNRISGYLDELDQQKEASGDGITSEFVSDVSRLIGQANQSLKLVGQLKKEIGVDSQLLLVEARMNALSNILVDTLEEHPQLLDNIEKKMLVMDVDYEVVG
tara:strand:+ start:176 stop:784 length:609 start_codon:yes stop_codon:yes gene_type:complete